MGSIGNMFSKVREGIEHLWPPRVKIGLSVSTIPDPRDHSVPHDIIALPGDQIVCDGPEQHVVAESLFTIKRGDDSGEVNKQFIWFQPPPKLGTEMHKIRCQHCDGRWVAGWMHLHFKGGWR